MESTKPIIEQTSYCTNRANTNEQRHVLTEIVVIGETFSLTMRIKVVVIVMQFYGAFSLFISNSCATGYPGNSHTD